MHNLKTGTITLLVAVFCCAALADEPPRHDVSQAWFKPELLINNRPEICEPIFKSYVDYFTSPEIINPLNPISTRYLEKQYTAVLTTNIRELEWTVIDGEEKSSRLAQWRQDGKYFGIVEQSHAIGWREPTFEYSLIDKQLSDSDLANGIEKKYGEGPISYLEETGKPGVFDVIYASDPRFNNFQQNTTVQLANVYSSKNRVYLSLSASNAYKPGPDVHLIASVITPRQINVVCKFTTWPSLNAIHDESKKISYYKDFEGVVFKIMGEGGSCGTLNAPGRAIYDLRASFNKLIVRPWTYASRTENYNLSSWGYSGAWNYRKYLEFKAIMPKVQQGLADKYAKDYRLNRNQALTLADAGIRATLARGFNHGYTEDEYGELHRALLEGRTVENVSSLLPSIETVNDEYEDSLLAFAIGHPLLVELLLKRGFDPNKANAFGKTPLMYAAQFNDLESAGILVKYGANTELTTTHPLDNCSYTITTNHVTALHYAVRYASSDFIAWLVKIGTVASVQDSNKNTPLDYLTKFGGYTGYQIHAELSYGKQNSLLSQAQIDSLTVLLAPLDEDKRQQASDKENRKAEALYRSGKIQEAYSAVKRALSLNSKNEQALLNLSLISLKLGYQGESAKAATYIIKNSHSEKERASAYFNLGLACQAEGKKHHYTAITYDGENYCQESWDRYHGPLYYYLKAYQTNPTRSRANTIVDFFEKPDAEHGKWLCKASDAQSNPRAVYVTTSHVYFLGKSGANIAYQRFVRRDQGKDNALEVTKKEEFPLGNGLSVFRWEVNVHFQGALAMGKQLCGRLLPVLFDEGTELVVLYANPETKAITVSSSTSKPIVLALYGEKTNWNISANSKNIFAIYVHGRDSSLQYPGNTKTVMHIHTNSYDGVFGTHLQSMTGLETGAKLGLSNINKIDLTDTLLSNIPRCDREGMPPFCREN